MQYNDQLKFDCYIEKLCKNANRKLHALARVTPYMNMSKKRILMNVFFGLQFKNYCPLISMCHSRKHYHVSNRLHGKGLSIIYNDKTSSYEELSKDSFISVHDKNLQKPVIETYEVVNRLCPEIINEVFQFQIRSTHNNLRNNSTFRIPSFNTIFKGDGKCILPCPKVMEPSTRRNKIFRILYKF